MTDQVKMSGIDLSGIPYGIEVSSTPIEVTSSTSVSDESWEGYCPAGHVCTWENILWKKGEEYFCIDCQDNHQDGKWVCPECSLEVNPGLKAPFREWVPGLVEVTLRIPVSALPEWIWNLRGIPGAFNSESGEWMFCSLADGLVEYQFVPGLSGDQS